MHIFRLSVVTLAVASISATTYADENQPETFMAPLVISDDAYRNTATKNQISNEETPQSISLIETNDIKQQGADNLSEAVRYTSGINTELRGGAVSRLDLFNIRGFINYQNYYDGLQLLYNDWNLQPQIDTAAVEKVEVFKGPTSALYGYMPPGGMVNIISKTPESEASNSVEVAVGSNNKRSAEFDSTGAISDELNYRVIGAVRAEDGQAVTSENERIMIAPSLDWQASENTTVNLNFYYQNDPKMGVYTSLPAKGTVLKNQNGKLDTDAFAGDANWNTYEKEVAMFGYKVNHKVSRSWSFLQNARFMDASAYQENTYSNGLASDERTLSRRAYLTDETSQAITIDNQFSGEIEAGAATHHLLLGLDYLSLDSNIQYEDAVAPTIDLYNPNHYQISPSNLDFAASGYSSDFDITKEQTGLYAQDQVKIDDWVLLAGLRHDEYHATEKGIKYGRTTDIDTKQSSTTGRVGILYKLENGISPYLNYAQSYEPIAGTDRNGNEFDPSEGHQWELGAKFESADTTANLAAYQIIKSKVKTRDPNGSAYDLIQVGEVRSQGIEADINHYINDEWGVRGALTVQDVEVTKDNSGIQGNIPVWVPEKQASLWLSYAPINGWLAGSEMSVGARYIGTMQIDAQNSDTVPDATLIDASISYDLAMLTPSFTGASVRFSVSNLADETYYSCYDTDNCWVGAERQYELSARYEF